MKQSEIDKIVQNAEFEPVDDETDTKFRTTIKELDATFDFHTETEDAAREELPEMIARVLNIRGVEITE